MPENLERQRLIEAAPELLEQLRRFARAGSVSYILTLQSDARRLLKRIDGTDGTGDFNA